jgi:membrane fusion protein, multidrug efflux system
MKHLQPFLIIAIAIFSIACNSNSKETTGSLSEKKTALEKLKKDQIALASNITKLEAEISKLDTTAAQDNLAKLVAIAPVVASNFIHTIDIQGHVEAENISYISPRLGPGQVKALFIKKGDYVKKGQLVLRLDDAVIKQAIAATKSNFGMIQTQLTTAKDIYNRTGNLWKQGIGTELQLIGARTNVETLEKQLHAAEEGVKVQQEQASAMNVYSDVEGIVEDLNIRVGETFIGASAFGPQIKIVNLSNLKVVADIPDNYSGKVKVGSKITVVLPDINKTYNSTISISGKVINPNNRSFIAEAKLPSDATIRPNQLAQVKIQDYAASNAIVIPINTVQTDEKGKFVFVAVKENNKLIARKKQVTVGEINDKNIEIKSGLLVADNLVTEAYQSIYDGQVIKVN